MYRATGRSGHRVIEWPVLLRIIAGALGGALAGAGALVLAASLQPALTIEFDRELGGVTRSYHEPERTGDLTWAWTRGDARLALQDLDRHRPWACTIRLRGARENPADLPVMTVTIDGTDVASMASTNDWLDLAFTVPPRPDTPGVIMVMKPSTTFTAGANDPRTLGVMVDRWSCAAVGTGLIRPPRRAMTAAATSGAAMGVALAVIGLSPLALVAAILLSSGAQAVAVTWDFASFSPPYLTRLPWQAGWIAIGFMVATGVARWYVRQPLSSTARFVLALSAIVLHAKLAALLHPSKQIVDAVFQAHRLEAVMAGNYFFTQPMPSGVQFPYAIGLYVFAWPWATFTRDHVLLLRVVVMTMEVGAGLLLYPMIVRGWADRWTAGAAVAAFQLVPISYIVIGNANLTNAFGQAVALVAIASAATMTLTRRVAWQWPLLFAVTSLALCSHVTTFVLLSAVLGLSAVLIWWRGDRAQRPVAYGLVAMLAGAIVFSVVTYYGHREFIDVYKGVSRVGGATTTSTEAVAVGSSLLARVARTGTEVARGLGWPLVLLALVGLVTMRDAGRDRVTLVLWGWLLAFGLLLIALAVMPVNGPFERYAAEFVGRVTHATYPAICVLAGRGLVRAWRAGLVPRAGACAIAAVALAIGVDRWIEWLR